MHIKVFTLPAVSFTAGSYTEDEANFPQENNLISQKIKVSSVDKVILRTFKTSSWENCLFNIFPLFFHLHVQTCYFCPLFCHFKPYILSQVFPIVTCDCLKIWVWP